MRDTQDAPAGDEPGDVDRSTHVYIVEYTDDAERKRVEYLFNNWSGGTIDKPSGLVRITEGIDHEKFYQELVSKVPPEQVASYKLERVDFDVEPDTVVVEQSIDAPVETVEPFVEYVLSKRNAVLQSPGHNEYEVYTKKGRAEITYRLAERGEKTTVTLRISGYEPAPAFLAEFFATELEDYANGFH